MVAWTMVRDRYGVFNCDNLGVAAATASRLLYQMEAGRMTIDFETYADVPMPEAKPVQIERVPMPKARKKKQRVPESVRDAAKAYKQAYLSVYGMRPTLTYDGQWIRLTGMREGVSVKRLREMTTQLRNKQG